MEKTLEIVGGVLKWVGFAAWELTNGLVKTLWQVAGEELRRP